MGKSKMTTEEQQRILDEIARNCRAMLASAEDQKKTAPEPRRSMQELVFGAEA